ncbi:MAG: hypothetical protein NVSMB29_04350 [Candidatus Dormibacteria bacterium]
MGAQYFAKLFRQVSRALRRAITQNGTRQRRGARRPRRSLPSLGASTLLVVALVAGGLQLNTLTASADINLTVTPTFPTHVTVGHTGLPASLYIANESSIPDNNSNVLVSPIYLVPSCGSTVNAGFGDCPLADADAGVFQLSPTATGEAGTACAGMTFTITVNNAATGQVKFTPTPSGTVVLTRTGTANSVCRIRFTFDVLREPTKAAQPSAPDSVTTASIGYAAGADGSLYLGQGSGSSLVNVAKATPSLTTKASQSIGLKNDTFIADTATLSAAVPPGPPLTGFIRFSLLDSSYADCLGQEYFSSLVPVHGPGTYTSGLYNPTAVGTYRWEAIYEGDANHVEVEASCKDAAEHVTVSQAGTPTLTTSATPSATVGQPITDTATLSGGKAPTGFIIFQLLDSTHAGCSGSLYFSSAAVVSGNGTYTSEPFTPSLPGTYRWHAIYTGDANNFDADSDHSCNDSKERSTVTKAPDKTTPKIGTQATSGNVVVGGEISDTAHLTGGLNPTGTITFTVFGPNNTNCKGSPAFTSTKTVAGNDDYTSDPFTPTNYGPPNSAWVGTYRWEASYSGDTHNDSVTSPCNAAHESTQVVQARTKISTHASESVAPGGTIHDTATLSGGFQPTGTITFKAYGPNNATCAGNPAVTSVKGVNGNGDYISANFTAVLKGTYRFVASYSGDANNNAVTTTCNDPNESTTVKARVTIATTASPSVGIGDSISDTATLSGGFVPAGTLKFSAYGPDNATCAGSPAFTSVKTVSDTGEYTSDSFTPSNAGTYRFVAAYSGDANNAPVTTACNDFRERTTVFQADTQIVTHASKPVTAGGSISDTATLSEGFKATGTITFKAYGPNDGTCDRPAAFTSVKAVNGDGDYTSDPFTVTSIGTYRFVASYSGDVNNEAVKTSCGDRDENTTVSKATPTISTQASAGGVLGGSIHDTATLSGGGHPTGTITFRAYGPNDHTQCDSTPAFTSVQVVSGDGDYTSADFTPSAVGTYRFVASYSGDANNNATSTACGDPKESSTIITTKAKAKLVTQASKSVPLGGSISDTATLSGGFSPTGTITFRAYGPNDRTECDTTAVFTSVKTVSGNGNYTSDPFTPSAPGTYQFVAAYNGDANNNAATTACKDPQESTTVSKADPKITTQASGGGTLGASIHDTATLSGGSHPTGTITFDVFGPNDRTECDSTPAFTSTKTVSGNGNYTSANFTPSAAGTYRFVASYNGDANNNAVITACLDPRESTTIVKPKATAKLVTQASAGVTLGGSITDTATLSGGNDPTGTITFDVFGPNDRTDCDSTPVFTSTKTVNGNGNYTSDPFTPSKPGTYQFVAAYGGDPNNTPAGTRCEDPKESTTVTKATPAIGTQASAGVTVGGSISDTAILSGGSHPIGTLTFTVFGPDNATCTGTALGTSTVTVVANGSYTSASFTTSAAGTYRFVAVYSGDADNAGATSPCNAANESVLVSAPAGGSQGAQTGTPATGTPATGTRPRVTTPNTGAALASPSLRWFLALLPTGILLTGLALVALRRRSALD